jgi:hypothetical protein
MKRIIALTLPFAAVLGLAACNAPAYHSQANFNAAGQNIGNGNLGAAANDTGHAFSEGANATGQAISNGASHVGSSVSQ